MNRFVTWKAGYCSRCGSPLGDAVYMVCEKYHDVRTCLSCLTPEQSASMGRSQWSCEGCDRRMYIIGRQRRGLSVCSDACAARVRRSLDHHKLLRCQVCESQFTSVRIDARYYS